MSPDQRDPVREERKTASYSADFSAMPKEQFEEFLGEPVREVLFSTASFSVFILERDLRVAYTENGRRPIDPDPEFERLLVRSQDLESIPTFELNERIRLASRRMIGQGIVSALMGELDSASRALDHAEAFIAARTAEKSRGWYLRYILLSSLTLSYFSLMAWSIRSGLNESMGESASFVALAVCMGSLGAMVSTIYRVQRFAVDPSAGKVFHLIEAIARTLAGAIGAVIVFLAFRAKLILGNVEDTNMAAILILCFLAGVCERVVPNMIRRP